MVMPKHDFVQTASSRRTPGPSAYSAKLDSGLRRNDGAGTLALPDSMSIRAIALRLQRPDGKDGSNGVWCLFDDMNESPDDRRSCPYPA